METLATSLPVSFHTVSSLGAQKLAEATDEICCREQQGDMFYKEPWYTRPIPGNDHIFITVVSGGLSLYKKLSTPLPGAVSRAIEGRTTIAVSLSIYAAEDTLGVPDQPHLSLPEQRHSSPANAAIFERCGTASTVSGNWTWASVSDKNLSLEFWKKLKDCH